MILLEAVLPGLLPNLQVNFKSYSLSKKIYLSQANRRDFFRPYYYAKLVLSRLLQISIYRLDDETNTVSQEIDLAILKALLKGMFC